MSFYDSQPVGFVYRQERELEKRVAEHLAFVQYVVKDVLEGNTRTRRLLDANPTLPLLFDLARIVVSYDSPALDDLDFTRGPAQDDRISWIVLEYVGIEQCCVLCRNAFELTPSAVHTQYAMEMKYERPGSLFCQPLKWYFAPKAAGTLHKRGTHWDERESKAWQLYTEYCTASEYVHYELAETCAFVETIKSWDRLCWACVEELCLSKDLVKLRRW